MENQNLPSVFVDFEVPFFDLDPMKIVWHGNYVKYFEQARCQLLRLFDYDYPDMEKSGFYWPIIDMRLKYVNASKFAQKLRCHAKLVEYENRLKIEYLIVDRQTQKKMTKGYTVQVAVSVETHEMQLVSPLILKQKLAPFIEA